MDKHVTVLGLLFLVLGLMGLIGIIVTFSVFFVGSAVLGFAASQEPDVPGFLTLLPLGLGMFISVVVAIQAVPSLVAAAGLLARKPWARTWALIAGILNLPSIPFGTGVGIYAIWVYLQDETAAALR